MPVELSELKRQSQKALVDFLWSEVRLANTFHEMSKGTRDSAHAAKLLEDVLKAASTIRHFQQRIADPADRKALNDEAEKLEVLLSADKDR